jgi:hypothetical protein
MIYGKEELDWINQLYNEENNREEISESCNKKFHDGRPIRTARSIEFVLLDKLKKKNDRFLVICDVCGNEFRSGWPNARYCGNECRLVIEREYARNVYKKDPKKNIQEQTVRVRERIRRRWNIILESKGDKCIKCGKTYPIVVYDLHHPNGKRNRNETPSRMIRGASEKNFLKMIEEVEIWCPICHRLHHAETGDWAPIRKGM